jgi:L-malate glycosyltransferase
MTNIGYSRLNGKPLHVMIMPSWYKSPQTTVLGTFFEEQARALQREGCKVGVIYPEYTRPGEVFSGEREKKDFYMDKGIPTFHIKTSAGIPKLRRLSYWRFSNNIREIFDIYCETFGVPDVIHAHSVFHAGIAGFHIARRNNIPFVITEHLTAYLMGHITNKVDRELAREIFEYADTALIVSNNFKEGLESELHLPTDTFKILHNLVADLFFENFTPKTHQLGETFHFFTNSFLLPRKNIKMIIDAIKILTDKNIDVDLRIGGEGPLKKELLNYINELGLENRIILTDKLTRQQVKTEIDNCHSFVLASQYETFGVVLIESLACGRPVVCTDSGGPRDFIGEGQGIMVKDHNTVALASAMEKIINDYSKYDQKAFSDYCYSRFNEKKIVSELMNYYKMVIERRPVMAI